MNQSPTNGRTVDADVVDQAVQEDLGREVMVREWPDLAEKLQSVKAALMRISDGALVKAREFSKVTDQDSRALASRVGLDCTVTVKIIKKAREACYEPLKKECDSLRSIFDEPLKVLKTASDTVGAGVTAYDIECRRKARIEQEAREAEARRQQEEYERKKKEYEAEKAAQIKAEEDARLAHAVEAQAQGNAGKVDAILAQSTPIVAPPPPPPPPPAPVPLSEVTKPADSNDVTVTRWTWELTDIKALSEDVSNGKAPTEYLTVERAPITRDVNRLKGNFSVRGIKAYPVSKTHFRTEDI